MDFVIKPILINAECCVNNVNLCQLRQMKALTGIYFYFHLDFPGFVLLLLCGLLELFLLPFALPGFVL